MIANTPPMPPLPSKGVQPTCRELLNDLIALNALDPQPRGYAFEAFLTRLFDEFGLAPREGFRLTGEQIDGSFALAGATYLVEAKWQNALTPAADLWSFQGKVSAKSNWVRGLFISYNGFTSDGLVAFGSCRNVVCMDKRDLLDSLERGIPLDLVLSYKIRLADETGNAFYYVCNLISDSARRTKEGRKLRLESDKQLLSEFRDLTSPHRMQWLREHHFGNIAEESIVRDFARADNIWHTADCQFDDFELRAPFLRVRGSLKQFAYLTWTYLRFFGPPNSLRLESPPRAPLNAGEAERELHLAAIELTSAIEEFGLVSDKLTVS